MLLVLVYVDLGPVKQHYSVIYYMKILEELYNQTATFQFHPQTQALN